jgi:hypothetical protein
MLPKSGLGNDFFGYEPKSIDSKCKNKKKKRQIGLHQTKLLLNSQGNNQQNEEITYRMIENICKPYI